nr:hypothetical protein [Micromonospora sp. DSM 115978]
SMAFQAGHSAAAGARPGPPPGHGAGEGTSAPAGHGGPAHGQPAASGSALWSFEVVQSAVPPTG